MKKYSKKYFKKKLKAEKEIDRIVYKLMKQTGAAVIGIQFTRSPYMTRRTSKLIFEE